MDMDKERENSLENIFQGDAKKQKVRSSLVV